ncbi:hypothetical protein AVEN_202168-1 [Araneus ventricosus]|uniref:Uncharacterized protein n=1 Tax=Araneus ventricosus TaxID=182803 RepID=A0A4Y2DW53_ARAVE|nr:hypothetical protein AVEN_56696-1 [Araneus ventricosus]GBM21100.1 hypothetical protein AVEN_202168-1 [Araneus ventricosus]
MERLRKLLAEVEIDDDTEFDNGSEDILAENFSDDESFGEHDTESEEDGDSGSEEVNNLEWFHQKMAYSGGKQNLGRIFLLAVIILCRVYLEQKGQPKMLQAL